MNGVFPSKAIGRRGAHWPIRKHPISTAILNAFPLSLSPPPPVPGIEGLKEGRVGSLPQTPPWAPVKVIAAGLSLAAIASAETLWE